jgi:hypothetical protein
LMNTAWLAPVTSGPTIAGEKHEHKPKIV